jgi:hypothetical protein
MNLDCSNPTTKGCPRHLQAMRAKLNVIAKVTENPTLAEVLRRMMRDRSANSLPKNQFKATM